MNHDQRRNPPRQQGAPVSRGLPLLQGAARHRPRQGPVRLGRRRQPVPRFLRRHRHHQRRALQRARSTGRFTQQLDTLQHVSTVFATEPQAALAKKIASITPGGRLTKSFFTNSGTEANETAILDRALLHRLDRDRRAAPLLSRPLVAGDGADRPIDLAARRRPQPGIVHAHNAYCYRCPFGLTYPECEVACAQDVEELIRTTTSGTHRRLHRRADSGRRRLHHAA